jgi:hypothetical protein
MNFPNEIFGTESSRRQFRACEKLVKEIQGKVVAPALLAGEEFTENFTYAVPGAYVAEECNIIVFVSINSASGDITVLQAGEIHLVE